jgi:HSP20 family protein
VQRLVDVQASSRSALIPVDLIRQSAAIVLMFDLPGVDPSGIDLSIDNHVVTVSAQRPNASDEADGEPLITERYHGHMTRQVFLGYSVDPEQSSATYTNGVLRVVVPLSQTDESHHIQVTAERGLQPPLPASQPHDTEYQPLALARTYVSDKAVEPSYGRQNAPNVESIAVSLLKGTFPRASSPDIERAAAVMDTSVAQDIEAGTIDFERAHSTAKELASLLARQPPQ